MKLGPEFSLLSNTDALVLLQAHRCWSSWTWMTHLYPTSTWCSQGPLSSRILPPWQPSGTASCFSPRKVCAFNAVVAMGLVQGKCLGSMHLCLGSMWAKSALVAPLQTASTCSVTFKVSSCVCRGAHRSPDDVAGAPGNPKGHWPMGPCPDARVGPSRSQPGRILQYQLFTPAMIE